MKLIACVLLALAAVPASAQERREGHGWGYGGGDYGREWHWRHGWRHGWGHHWRGWCVGPYGDYVPCPWRED